MKIVYIKLPSQPIKTIKTQNSFTVTLIPLITISFALLQLRDLSYVSKKIDNFIGRLISFIYCYFK